MFCCPSKRYSAGISDCGCVEARGFASFFGFFIGNFKCL